MGNLERFEDACLPYINKDGFIGGNPIPPDMGRVCDNHSMFTAEYHRIRKDLGATDFDWDMFKFLTPEGQPLRYPGADADLSPDDYLGLLNFFKLTPIGKYLYAGRLLSFGFRNLGFYNSPKTREGFLWRQPQLLTAALATNDRIKWYSFWYFPLVLYTALVIAVAGTKASPVDDQDTRRLSWHLIQVMQDTSLLCRLAASLWWKRLRKQYGEDGIRLVFGRYFGFGHPFARYAVNEWEKK